MNFVFGELYYANCDPSFGHEYQGKRPVMIIQEENISMSSELVTILPLTTKLDKQLPSDIFIEKDQLNNLTADSVIKVRHIQSFDKRRFAFRIGRAGSPTIRSVRGYLRRHFGF